MSQQSRRRFLVVLGAVPAFGACALATTDYSGSFANNNDPDGTDGGGGGTTTGGGTATHSPADSGSGGTTKTGGGATDSGSGGTTTTSGGPTDSGSGGTTTSGTPDSGSGGTTTTPPPTDSGTPPVETGPTCTPLSKNLGPTSMFPSNSWTQVGSGRSAVVVGHDSGGYYVVSAVCTHAGCTNDPPDSSGGQYCSCHGASFDADGNVTGGPARSNLKNYKVVVCGGNVTSDLSTTVAAGTRAN
jgi:Rieske Fe-S protein